MHGLPRPLVEKANCVLEACGRARRMITVAESCTGGLVTAALTAIPGSSAWVERSFVTYSNDAKTEMLGVPAPLLAQWGAVSEPVARAMAEGALAHSRAQASVAITGIAGPGGGTPEKPVGTVHFAVALAGAETLHEHLRFDGDRDTVRYAAAMTAMDLLIRRLGRG